ncbi:NaeI family type II restriction endonuclease [Corynebacterium amycolatum]|uniref:NaeI family type II restriction endonuclease n=1 Tax=Corynebacterium amycolatum TaxID=43765 RepID=UPI000185C2A7|nr:NaeI family type II restriction endonuclease [Corynebacterium amycolatum]EEB64047.1 restriction endonuclease NaeI [Corynebacterium amycolatum SK46]
MQKITSAADSEVEKVKALIRDADPVGDRFAKVFRETYYLLYNGQKTGRYRWEQLYKTEKTHFGTLIEIAIRHEFAEIIDDGIQKHLDYRIAGIDVDCKFSMNKGSWMIPVEAENEIIIGLHSSDEDSCFSVCVERASSDKLTKGGNRDRKRTFTRSARSGIDWIFDDAPLPVNRLLHLSESAREKIFSNRSGQKRVNEFFRQALGLVINREDIATVAKQRDYMKRVRGNGGARTALAAEGIIILTGKYMRQMEIAEQLAGVKLRSDELIALRVVSVTDSHRGRGAVEIDGQSWRVATSTDPVVQAPISF